MKLNKVFGHEEFVLAPNSTTGETAVEILPITSNSAEYRAIQNVGTGDCHIFLETQNAVEPRGGIAIPAGDTYIENKLQMKVFASSTAGTTIRVIRFQ